MPVYVDDMRAKYGRMVMCHMLADTDDELHAMASRIGVARRWHQKPDTPHSHYDICLSKRALAVKLGAQEVDRAGVVAVIKKKRAGAAPQCTRCGGQHSLSRCPWPAGEQERTGT